MDDKEREPARVAVGVYLRARARRRGLTDDAAARALGVGSSTVQRLYAGRVGTDWLTLFRLLALVGGDAGHVAALVAEPSIERAAELAEQGSTPTADPLAAQLARAAVDDPGLVDAVLGFIAGRRSRG